MNESIDEWKQEHRAQCERDDAHPAHEWAGVYQWWCPGVDN